MKRLIMLLAYIVVLASFTKWTKVVPEKYGDKNKTLENRLDDLHLGSGQKEYPLGLVWNMPKQ